MAKKVIKAETAQELQDVYLALTTELYRTFDFMNVKLAEGKLPRPVITVATAGKAKAHGIFCNSQWKTGETILHEITMCGESLNRPIPDTIGTLIHEMVHLSNFVKYNEVKDCTDQQRHNKIFKDEAERFGLTVESSKRFGYAHTTPGEKALVAIEELSPKTEVYDIYRANFQDNKKEKKKYKSKLKPVMVDEETKTAIEEGAKEMGMSQKEFAQAAVTTFRTLNKNAKEAAEIIFENRKKYKTAVEIEALLIDMLLPSKAPVEEVATEEGVAGEE